MATVVLLLLGGSGSAVAPGDTNPAEVPDANGRAVIFITGNELGQLKPCGCSGGMLGGFDRRGAVFGRFAPSSRVILDTGSIVSSSSEQDLIKFNIALQAFELLGYDVVNLTESDIEIAGQLGLLDSSHARLSTIASRPAADSGLSQVFSKQINAGNARLRVIIAAMDAPDVQSETVTALFDGQADGNEPVDAGVNVLILNQRDATALDIISQTGIVDCVIITPEADEPLLVSEPNATPLVIAAGRLGKHVGVLQISPETSGGVALAFTDIPVTEKLPVDEQLAENYKLYQQLVKEAMLLDKHPRFTLPDSLEYVGSAACRFCHEYEYERWKPTKHADAYNTLAKVGSQYDPECIGCHVIGFDYESGYRDVEKTPEMKDVGCENCHGPGSEHIQSLGGVMTNGPMARCVDCHTSEHSAEYEANQKDYFEKIIHWREPVSRRNVE